MFWPLFLGRLFSLPFLQMLDSSIQDQDSWSLGMGGRQAGQSTCVYTCLGIGVGFFAICDVFFIYIFHCVFSLSIFFLCLANSFTHIYRGLWRRRRQWVSGFLLLLFLFSYLSEFWFLRKILLLLFILVKFFFFSFLFTLYLYQCWLLCVALP